MRARWVGVGCLLAVAGASRAAAEETAAARPATACDRVVRGLFARLEGSPAYDLRVRVLAHRITALTLEGIGRRLAAPARWKEGDPFWEEAYALLGPELLTHMRSTAAAEFRYQEANLPRHLDPEICEKYVALAESRLGSIAQRVRDAADAKEMLASSEKAFPTPARLQPLREKVREAIEDDAKLSHDPEVRRDRARFDAIAGELRSYDRRHVDALKKLGDGRGPEQARTVQHAAEELVARHQDRLADILRRFGDANAK